VGAVGSVGEMGEREGKRGEGSSSREGRTPSLSSDGTKLCGCGNGGQHRARAARCLLTGWGM
jgi:hypothetical protein